MPIVFPANPGDQTPENVFSPTSTPVQNTFNEASYRWVAADSQWVYDGPNVDPNPGSAIATPTITNPADETTNINPGVDLTINSSAYTVQSGNPGTHASSDWQVLEGVSPKISIDTVGGVTTVDGNEETVQVYTRTSNDSNSNFRGPLSLYADGNNWFILGSDGRPSGNSNTHGPTRYFFSTDNAETWTEGEYFQTGTGTDDGDITCDTFDDFYIGYVNTRPTVSLTMLGLRKDSAFTGTPVWQRFLLRSIGDGIGNTWNPNMDTAKIGNWSNGKYITFNYHLTGGATEGREYRCKAMLWSELKAITDGAFTSQPSLFSLTGVQAESGWEGAGNQTLATSYKILGTDNDAYNLLYTEETKSGQKTVQKMRITWDETINTSSFDEANTLDLTDILDSVPIHQMIPWPSQNCVVCRLGAAGLMGVYRNGGTSANPQVGTFEIIETPKDTVTTQRMYIGPDDFLYLLSSNNAEWTRTSDLVNFTTEQVAADTGFRAPFTISSNGRMGSVTPQDNDMASSTQPVEIFHSDQFFDATILDIANCNQDSGVIGKAFVAGDSIQNSGGAAASGTIFELNNSTVSLFPVEGTWMSDDSQKIRSKIEDYNVVIDNRSDTENLTSITVPAASLNANEEYSIRVGYRSNSNVTSLDSPWSTFETGN